MDFLNNILAIDVVTCMWHQVSIEPIIHKPLQKFWYFKKNCAVSLSLFNQTSRAFVLPSRVRMYNSCLDIHELGLNMDPTE